VQISFAKRKLQKTCEEHRSLKKMFGDGCGNKIAVRLADLRSAASLEEFRALPGGCHELAGDRDGQLALDLPDGKRLIFKPSEDPAPTKEDGGLDWGAVDAVEVIEIVDYH
jgi:proteic killer suppression protein